MDTTPTLEMLTNPGSAENHKAVNQQLKVVLAVMEHTKGVVLGGCPRDHFDDVAAADVDIYVRSLQEVETLIRVLNITEFRELWSEGGGAQPDGSYTANDYLTVIYEGFAVIRKAITKVNIMVVKPSVCSASAPRSALALSVLQHYPHSMSHFAYFKVLGKVCLLRFSASVDLGVQSGNAVYDQKVLRKLLLRRSRGGVRILTTGYGPMPDVRSAYWERMGTSFTTDVTRLRYRPAIRVIKKNNSLGVPVTKEILGLPFPFIQVPSADLIRLEEGETSLHEYLQSLTAQIKGSSVYSTEDLRAARGEVRTVQYSSLFGSGSAGSLSQLGVGSGSDTPSVQPSGRTVASMVQTFGPRISDLFS